mmetsp:Transcript_10032/g.20121  ORF Transcript_10032/g.20121 Transcript_10032/m.20121 type:complete len:201 (+) Transcript_10032:587-1189(+)
MLSWPARKRLLRRLRWGPPRTSHGAGKAHGGNSDDDGEDGDIEGDAKNALIPAAPESTALAASSACSLPKAATVQRRCRQRTLRACRGVCWSSPSPPATCTGACLPSASQQTPAGALSNAARVSSAWARPRSSGPHSQATHRAVVSRLPHSRLGSMVSSYERPSDAAFARKGLRRWAADRGGAASCTVMVNASAALSAAT